MAGPSGSAGDRPPGASESRARSDREPRARSDQIIDAMLSVTSDLDLEATLRAIVRRGMDLVDARSGALEVLGDDREPAAFIHEGVDGQTPDMAGPPPEGREVLGAPILVRGAVYGNLFLTRQAAAADFSDEDESTIRALASAAGIAVDNARNHAQAQSRLRWIEATREVHTALLAGAGNCEVLGLITRTTLALTDADLVFIAQPDDPEHPAHLVDHLVVTVASGSAADLVEGAAIPVSGSTTGAAFTSRRPFRGRRLEYAVTHGVGDGFGPVLAAPMRAGDSTTGVLVALRASGRPAFTGDVVGMTATFADQAALALHLGAAAARARHVEVLAERERIARDLHDQVIQRIFAEGLSLQATLQRTSSPDIRDRLTRTVDTLQEIVQEIRTTIFDLQSGDTPTARLRHRIHEVIDQQLGDSAIRTHLRISGPLSVVDRRTAEHLVAVVREAVSNVVRHAHAESLTVTVRIGDDVVVEVADDGVGLRGEADPSGLANLRRRAEALGGTLTTPPQTRGALVRWSVPLR